MKKLLFLLPFLIVAASCQKVIDIDLNSKDPVVVIEANITDQPGPYTVSVTKTVNFSNTNDFPAVSGATVVISDDLGNTETLVESTAGNYQTSLLQGAPGRTYSLSVTAEGKTYTAQSTMPAAIELDSLVAELSSAFGGRAYVIPLFTDPAGQGNRYRAIEFINGERVEGSFLFDDIYSNGLVNGQPLLDFESELEENDTVQVEFQCIDQPVFLYFFSMLQNTTGQTGAPANPVSNISNGALGYFSAHTVRKKSVVIP
jgi:hypothetical protein